ncbi:MAG TPA: transposase [Gaiellaceae bacterium]|jgi:REP element-mobilizing transposase RayT
MARRLRSNLPDGYFHVTARGVAGEHVYLDDDDRRTFLAILAAALTRTRLEVHALCLMGTHYHLVLDGLVRDLSRVLHRVNGTHAQAFNARHGRFGHLFADRFSARAIESEEHLVEACRYVVLNPVRAGLVDSPAEWPWSRSRYGFDVA